MLIMHTVCLNQSFIVSVILAIKGMDNSSVEVGFYMLLRITGCVDSARCLLEPVPHCVCDTGYKEDGKVQCPGRF